MKIHRQFEFAIESIHENTKMWLKRRKNTSLTFQI